MWHQNCKQKVLSIQLEREKNGTTWSVCLRSIFSLGSKSTFNSDSKTNSCIYIVQPVFVNFTTAFQCLLPIQVWISSCTIVTLQQGKCIKILYIWQTIACKYIKIGKDSIFHEVLLSDYTGKYYMEILKGQKLMCVEVCRVGKGYGTCTFQQVLSHLYCYG